MPNKISKPEQKDFFDVDQNMEATIKVLHTYYRKRNHSGEVIGNIPDVFLVRPQVFDNLEVSGRASEKILMDDMVKQAKARNGYISITKHRNPKLNYYWLELSVLPFKLGDPVTDSNNSAFFHIVTRFIDYAKKHPKMYGDLTAEIDSDKDLALMLLEIERMASKLGNLQKHYPLDMLVSFNPNWPVGEVKQLLSALKGNDQDWCEVFFEHLIYVMSKKNRT